jgi:hypothetical protein
MAEGHAVSIVGSGAVVATRERALGVKGEERELTPLEAPTRTTSVDCGRAFILFKVEVDGRSMAPVFVAPGGHPLRMRTARRPEGFDSANRIEPGGDAS